VEDGVEGVPLSGGPGIGEPHSIESVEMASDVTPEAC
jgi:hypothetical protein